MIDTSRLFHLGYVIRNMERAIKIWTQQGAGLVVPPAVDPIQNVTCALLWWQNAIAIELVAPLPEGPNPVASRLEKGGGLDHICLFTDDLAAGVKEFVSRSALCAVAPVYGAVFDRHLAFLQTRDGLTVELMEHKPVGRLSTDPLTQYNALTRDR